MSDHRPAESVVNSVEFREALSRFASGVTVVTTKVGEVRSGVTVSAFSSLSLDPPLVLICIEKRIFVHDQIGAAGRFVVNILGREQEHVSQQFASRVEDRFEGIDVTDGIEGLPLLEGSLARIECSLHSTLEGGDHTIFVGLVERSSVSDGKPLLYYRSAYRSID